MAMIQSPVSVPGRPEPLHPYGEPRAIIPALLAALLALRCVAGMLLPAVRQPGLLDWFVAVAAAAGLLVMLTQDQAPSRPRQLAAVVVGAYWIMPALSAVLHWQPVPGSAVAMALVSVAIVWGDPLSAGVFRIVFLAGGLVCALSLMAGIAGKLGLNDAAFYGTEVYQRDLLGLPALSGIALHPNSLAQIAGITLVVAVAVAHTNRKPGAWLIAGVALLPLLWSQSRTSIAASLLCALLLLLLWRHDRLRPWLLGVALVAAVAPPLLSWTLPEAANWYGIFNARPWAWFSAAAVFKANPVIGFGPEVLSRDFWLELGYTPAQGWQPLHAHNEALEAVAQAGLLGLLALLALVIVGVAVALRRPGANGRLACVTVIFLAIQAGFEVPLGLPHFPPGYLLPLIAVGVMSYAGSLRWRRESGAPVVADK